MLKYLAWFPLEMWYRASQFAVFFSSKSDALNLITSTPCVFSTILPSYCNVKIKALINTLTFQQKKTIKKWSGNSTFSFSSVGRLSFTSRTLMVTVDVAACPSGEPFKSWAFTVRVYLSAAWMEKMNHCAGRKIYDPTLDCVWSIPLCPEDLSHKWFHLCE